MAAHEHRFTTPVGRMIGGSLYTGKTTNDKGEALVFKTGKNKGQPRTDYNFGVAFPKTPGVQHWASESWLQAVWNLGHAAFPQGQAQRRDFSWKIIDGDSAELNKAMKRPCDQEGYPGHWVIWFSSTQAPKATNATGSEYLLAPDSIVAGYYVQVFCDVTENNGETPGLYWNPHYVALAGYGATISNGPGLAAAGFGQGVALPPGASTTPPAGMAPPPVPGAPPPPPGAPAPAPAMAPPPPPPPPAAPAPAGLVQVPGAQYTIEGCRSANWTDDQIIAAGVATRAAPAPMAPPSPLPVGSVPPPPGGVPGAPVPVTPNPAFTQMAAPPAMAPPPPPPPPAAPAPIPAGRTPTAKAEGRTLDQLLAMPGWTEAMLVQHGYVV